MVKFNNLITKTIGVALAAGALCTAIHFSPGRYHMDAYELASSTLVTDKDRNLDWEKAYRHADVGSTYWHGFDLTTEQLNSFANRDSNK